MFSPGDVVRFKPSGETYIVEFHAAMSVVVSRPMCNGRCEILETVPERLIAL
ncbi:hypothetical protein ACFXHA_12745 [Nocardia sp. NPDC059240]|uniref:hypothetical protein n=1 Tax=Nocardia sp. NPDC059240 TaxID=3346786 RepID=UPI00368ABB8C